MFKRKLALDDDPKALKRARKAESRDMSKYVNKQRTLVFSSRGVNHRDRHFMNDLRDILPHSKKDVKLDIKAKLYVINEIASLKSCNSCVFLEARKHKDLYMWLSFTPNGPCAKFLVQNVHTMAEVKLTGNSMKGARPVLNFDAAFDSSPHFKLLKELFIQIFGTPKGHPKSKPFIDHVFSFFIADGCVWFRNYQIINPTELDKNGKKVDPVLVEVGPHFVLNPIKIFAGSFGGATFWENKDYVSPNVSRSLIKRNASEKYKTRQKQKSDRATFVEQNQLPTDELDTVFDE